MKREEALLGTWLRKERLKRGLTIRALAERAGITHPRISQIESGDEATRDMVMRLVTALAGEHPDEHIYNSLLNAGLKAAFPRPEDAYDADGLETLVSKAGYSADILDDEGRERLRQSVDAAVIGVMEQERRRRHN